MVCLSLPTERVFHKLNCPVLFIARIQLIIYIFTRYKLN